MADDNNQAAASLPAEAVPAVRPVVPVEDERRPLLVDVEKPPASSPPPVVAGRPWMILRLTVVLLWALFNAAAFTAMNLARLILDMKLDDPCKSTWIFHCVTLTDAAYAEVSYLVCGEALCSAAAALAVAAAVHMLLLKRRTTTTTTTSLLRSAVHVLLWVALAATVGIHGMYVASAHIVLASDPGNTVHLAFGYVCLALDLVAGVLLLCCSPRRHLEQLCENQGGKDGEV